MTIPFLPAHRYDLSRKRKKRKKKKRRRRRKKRILNINSKKKKKKKNGKKKKTPKKPCISSDVVSSHALSRFSAWAEPLGSTQELYWVMTCELKLKMTR